MKPPPGRRGAVPRPAFSRPSRAGLIEAQNAITRWARCTHFPALHGRASLKRQAALASGSSCAAFSRPSRAGLIEARCVPPQSNAVPGDFPALHGRASLKPGSLPARPDRFTHFPALHGRASLKRGPRRAGRAARCTFSRPSRAGLIEARAAARRAGASAAIFPPFTGGPH